jgi:hypothetical protein
MDGVIDRLREFSSRAAGGDASVAFAAFVLVHAGCGKEVMESRLSEDTVACRCLRCEETGIFGPADRDALRRAGRPSHRLCGKG